jgi:hypothetical protein
MPCSTEGVMARLESVLALVPIRNGIQCSEFAGESEFNLWLHDAHEKGFVGGFFFELVE